MKTIKEVLMERDGLSESDAEDCIASAKEDLINIQDFDEYENFCYDHFGLEPDYMAELM